MNSFQRYQAEFANHIRDPRGHPRPRGAAKRRMDVYVEIVFNNMEGSLAACFPVCKKILGVRRWKKLVRDFLAQHRCTTPIFRQIPEELLHWLETAPAAVADLPPFFASLAHYEWAELAVATSEATLTVACDPAGDLLEGEPVLAPSLMLLRYVWPVHRISPRFQPVLPCVEPVHLLVFRDRQDMVRFIALNPVSARLIGLLQQGGHSGRRLLEDVAAEIHHPDPRAVMRFGRTLLEDLRRQGAIWGTIR
jgi:hypothetical protein